MSLLVFFVCLLSRLAWCNTDAGFQQWMHSYGKEYESSSALESAKKNWFAAYEFISTYNGTAELALNEFADISYEEFSVRLGFKEDADSGHRLRGYNESSGLVDVKMYIPSRRDLQLAENPVDYRGTNIVGPIQNQGNCGSCYAFAAVEAVEAAYVVAKGTSGSYVKHPVLSEQQIVDCSRPYGNMACSGGNTISAWSYIKNNGICRYKKYPYVASPTNCHECRPFLKWGQVTTAFYIMKYSNLHLKAAVVSRGAVTASIYSSSFLKYYSSGIFACSSEEKRNHSVLVVGYGTDLNGRDYWIVRNSWGIRWGMQGYFYLHMARDSSDYSDCMITTYAYFPEVNLS